jgi:hypothetical protein
MKMKNKQRDILSKVKNHNAQFLSWKDGIASYEITEVSQDSMLSDPEKGKVTTIIKISFEPDKNHSWKDFQLLKEHKVWAIISKEGLNLLSMSLSIK